MGACWAQKPALSESIEIDGLSVSAAIKHPKLRSALEAFHDFLVECPDSAGPGRFALSFSCDRAGHRLTALPGSPQAITQIWRAVMEELAPDYREQMRKHIADIGEQTKPQFDSQPLLSFLQPVLTARTIRGSRILLSNAAPIRWMVMKAFNKRYFNPGITQFENFVFLAEREISKYADIYDPGRRGKSGKPAKFSTYLYKRLQGLTTDSLAQTKTIAMESGDLSWAHVWSGSEGRGRKVMTSDESRSSLSPLVVPVPETQLGDTPPLIDLVAKVELKPDEIVILRNLISEQPLKWNEIAKQLETTEANVSKTKARIVKYLGQAENSGGSSR